MAIKTKLSLTIFLFFLLALLCSNLAIAREEKDPELMTCKHQCEQQRQYDEEDKRICVDKCDDYIRTKHERQKHKEHEEEDEREEEDENPYVFEYEDFEPKIYTEDGRISILNKFMEKSKLLQNFENYGLAILDVKAQAFVSPHHYDSEAIFFNIKGKGIIGLVAEDKTERFNLEEGDIMRVPAGTPVYLVNRDENEKLFIAAFHMPPSSSGSAPVNLEPFFGPAGRKPESILTAFTTRVLQAAFKASRGELDSVLGEQRKGRIFKVKKEDVLGLAPKRTLWPFGGPFKGPFNIFSNSPSFSNQFGRLIEVGPSQEKSGLEGLNLMLSFANITKGSMSTILYNTNANKIALVIAGEGEFEMACPHVPSSSSNPKQKKSSISYHNINAKLKPGVVFVVPAGHPFVNIASKNNNLMIVCFEVNAQRNKRLSFAGKNNIVSALDKTAKELSFDLPAKKVDELFERKEEFFFPYDNEERKEEHGRADV